MSLLNISEAARAVQVSRQTIHNYLNTGKLSFTTDETGCKVIDLAELRRVFPELHHPLSSFDTAGHNLQPELQSEIDTLRNELRMTRELLSAREEHIADLQHSLRLLEYKPQPYPAPAAPDQERPSWVVRLLTYKLF